MFGRAEHTACSITIQLLHWSTVDLYRLHNLYGVIDPAHAPEDLRATALLRAINGDIFGKRLHPFGNLSACVVAF